MSHVEATASGNSSKAQNNIASNIGSVGVGAALNQYASLSGSYVKALASGNNSRAVQNISSNNGCQTCQ